MTPAPSVSHFRHVIEQLLVLERERSLREAALDDRDLVEKLLATVDTAPVLLSYVDTDERYRFCNQSYERWFGASREQVVGRAVRQVVGDAGYETIREQVRAALSGRRVRFELAVPYRDGGTRVVQADYLPHVDANGHVAGFVAMVSDVTEARRGEEAERIAHQLRDSQDRLRLALEAAALGTWDLDYTTGQRNYSDRALEQLGLAPGTPLTSEILRWCAPPEDHPRLDAALQAAHDPNGDGAFRLEFRVVGPRVPRERWLLARGQVHFNAQRRPLRIVGTLQDITENRRARLRADRLAAVSSALSRVLSPEEVARVVVREGAAALEAVAASLVLLSEDGTAFELRAAHGFPEGTLGVWQRFPVDTAVMYRDAVRTGKPVLYADLDAYLRDYPERRGSPTLLGRAFAALSLTVDGRVLGAFGFIFSHEQDFEPEMLQFMESLGQQCALALERARLYDAERRARAEAERLRDRLATERSLLEAVLDQLPVGVVIAEPGGRLVRGNSAIETIWGHPYVASEDIPGYVAYQGTRPDGTAYAPHEWPLARALMHGETVLREPVRLRMRDGSARHIDLSATRVQDAEGRVVAAVAVSTDVTAHHQMREALRREAEVRDRLMGIVGHDLRNPLQAIATSGTMLLRDSPPDSSQHKRASRIITSVRRMDHLIRDLLDFARASQGGTLPIQRQRMSLDDACHIIVDELLAAYPERDIHLDLRGDLTGQWDLDRLVQLLGNLVVNAFTHGAKGVPVEVRADGTNDEVVLEVANAGNPIPPALLPRIFEPFTRAAVGGDSLKGVGLGLFIVHEIVTAHGGRIQVTSTRETGTVFQMRLPRGSRR
ncbi:PAS domain-containing protein [Pyxidicoccus fallax]|uniref:histidine kinase n=1 Tax=Pyxidicoccus fallax TaxID=394095 RepID=A0A848LZ99_9BACT|nr:PAS domain-containing protein [Pyxidicoccus fallax]NMO22930.1 PAS domain-containing protein [Pyxidicoccus fallax]NPC85359.1 PAS domain-containing protein [Pyxidicoccus fallax]